MSTSPALLAVFRLALGAGLLGLFAPLATAQTSSGQPSSLPELKWHLAARPWTPLDTPRTDPLDKVEAIITALAPLQYWNTSDPGDVQDGGDVQNGAIIDPFNLREHQYATPYFSFAVATAVSEGRAISLLESGARALDHSTADIAGLDGSAKANDNHGEFFGAPMMKALRLFKQIAPRHPAILTAARIARWESRLSTSRVSYMNNGVGQNWRTYAMKGEWLRVQDGLVPRAAGTGSGSYQGVSFIEWYWNNEQRARYSRDRDQFLLEPHYLMYHDDDTNSRQNFAYHGGATGNLLDLIVHGYDGPSRNDIFDTIGHAARSSLLTMSGNGDAPASGRTGNHIWNDVVYGNTYEQMAELAWAAGDKRLAGQFRRAARLAFQSAWRFQQEQGWFSVTKSLLPPSHKNVYYDWSALTNYNGYTEIHSAEAFATRLTSIPEQPAPAEIGGFAFNLDSQFATSFANAGGMQVQLCTRGSSQSANDRQAGVNSFTLGIVRFSRPDWESRLGPADGWTAADWSQAISFAPTFLENGVWKTLSELPDRYGGVFTPSFVHPLLVRGTLALTPKPGQTGPGFALNLVITPDGVLVDAVRTAGAEDFGVVWPLMEFDGKHVLDARVGSHIASTAYPKQSATRLVFEAESATLSGGAAAAASNPGFGGSGYVALPAASGAIEWSGVPGGDGGSAAIGFRYTLPQAAAASRTLTLRVNGEARSLRFVHTGNANTYGGGVLAFPMYWHQVHVPVSLLAGSANTVRLESADGAGLAIDELRVFPADASRPEPDQQTFVALDNSAAINAAAAPRRSAYGDQRPLRVTNAGATVSTFVYPRKASDPAAEAVRASFVRDGADFTSVLGRVRADTYVGRTSAGGVGAGVDLDGDGSDDVTFGQSCAFVLQLDGGAVSAVEADRFVTFRHAGREIALAPHTPVKLGAFAGFWNHLALPVSGRRFETTVEFTPPSVPSGEMLAGFSGEGVSDAGSLAIGLSFGSDARVAPLSGAALVDLAYSAGAPHRIRLLVDFMERRFDLWVKPAGQPERQLLARATLPASVKSAADLDTFAWISAPASAAGNAASTEFATPFSAKINFQTATSAGYPGYLADTGAAYGDRGNGLSYGWIGGANTGLTRDRNSSNSPDERYDTLNQMQYNNPPTETHTWEIAVPDGAYDVRLVCGDPDYTDSYYHVLAEGVTVTQGNAQGSGRRFIDQRARVLVTDGRLSLTNGPGSYRNKICFIEIDSTASRAYPFVSYNAWSASRFPAGSDDPAADPDLNGVPNALEYASLGSSSVAPPALATLVRGAPGLAEFSFLRSARALDAGYSVWESDDLVHWNPLWSNRDDADFSSPLVALANPSADGWVKFHVPLDAERPRHFLRLQVAIAR